MNRAQRRAAEHKRRGAATPRVHVSGLETIAPELAPAVDALRAYLNSHGKPREDVSTLVLIASTDGRIGLLPRHEFVVNMLCAGETALAREFSEPVAPGSLTIIATTPDGLFQRARARSAALPQAINAAGGAA